MEPLVSTLNCIIWSPAPIYLSLGTGLYFSLRTRFHGGGELWRGQERGAGLGLGDFAVGMMAWLNIVAILILQKPALTALVDYEALKKAGKDPVFDPQALGIKHADFWEKRD